MAAPMWMPGATRLAALQDGGSMTGRDAYVTWHTFECDYSVSATVGARYLNSSGNQVTLVFHPITGDVVQLIPANRAGRGLQNRAGGVETNRQGRVNVQIEVIGRSSRPWTKDLTAAGRAGLRRIIAWLDDLGVPRTAPNGYVGPTSYAASTKRPRSIKAWNGPGGYFCHADVPENDHWDHGPIDMRDLWAVADGHPTTPQSKEDELMDVKNPVTGEQWPAEKALWSIWTYAFNAARDAAVARKLAEATAKAGKPLTAAQIDDIAAATVAAFGKDVEFVLTPKEK